MTVPDNLLDGVSLPGLLRTWRAEAGEKMGLKKPLPQKQVAERMEVSERWYRNLEGGQTVPLPGPVLKRLATALALGPDDRMALFAQTLSRPFTLAASIDSTDVRDRGALDAVVEMASTPGPHPVYVVDSAWNLVSFNPKMAEWFPEICQPRTNLLRWVFSADGRAKLVDWQDNAERFLGQLRFSLANHPDNLELRELLRFLLAHPEVSALWERSPRLIAYREGELFRFHLPSISPDELSAVARVFLPPYLPGIRYVTLMPH